MPTKTAPPPIEIEDASQLSILAYQVRNNRIVDLKRFMARLSSDYARRIAEAIAEGGKHDAATAVTAAITSEDVRANVEIGEDTERLAGYYLRWAEDTANNARTASRHPAPGSRKGTL